MSWHQRRAHVRSTVLCLIAVVSLTMDAAVADGQRPADKACGGVRPAGVRALDVSFWESPWVFEAHGAAPLKALESGVEDRPSSGIRVRLDDGTVGTLRTESGPCGSADDCLKRECGCFDHDSKWIIVADGRGRTIARMHLWAAYGSFTVVPIDLVDGPGDELIIVTVAGRSSPPAGNSLKVWQLGKTKPIELGSVDQVAASLYTYVISCARWRTHMFIDRAAPKPRSIVLRTELAMGPCCGLDTERAREVARLKRVQVARFDAVRHTYAFPPPPFVDR